MNKKGEEARDARDPSAFKTKERGVYLEERFCTAALFVVVIVAAAAETGKERSTVTRDKSL